MELTASVPFQVWNLDTEDDDSFAEGRFEIILHGDVSTEAAVDLRPNKNLHLIQSKGAVITIDVHELFALVDAIRRNADESEE